MNKYGNIKCSHEGEAFDSKKERDRYIMLKQEQKNGDITDLSLQPRFTLLEAGTNSMGKKYRKTEYVSDFKYYDVKEKTWVVEDVKSKATRTPLYMLKKKLFFEKYPHYYFQEV